VKKGEDLIMEKLIVIRDLIAGNAFLGICMLIVLDTIFGILVAVKKGEFDLQKIANYLAKSVAPYIGGLGILYIASFVNGEIKTLFALSAGAAGVQFLAQIKAKLVSLFASQENGASQ
jgi:hypothetical protein